MDTAALPMKAFRLEETAAILTSLIASEECRSRIGECAAAERRWDPSQQALAFVEQRIRNRSGGHPPGAQPLP